MKRFDWYLTQYIEFENSFSRLVREVEALPPVEALTHPKAKLLKRITSLIYDEIPQNPFSPQYFLGKSLGPGNTNWRRAKFFGRFRLFFRFDTPARQIVYAWVNDENTLRQAGGRSDPYAVFQKMLRAHRPPTEWVGLRSEARPLLSKP
ncbi:MAG: type II toxin-antitoxin system YhaV family toxin [Alphaproteobacteria bacterium]|nr:type II toxin-antitoxin system YhaV family toxin [Alphaproteobacteria bacterium]